MTIKLSLRNADSHQLKIALMRVDECSISLKNDTFEASLKFH